MHWTNSIIEGIIAAVVLGLVLFCACLYNDIRNINDGLRACESRLNSIEAKLEAGK